MIKNSLLLLLFVCVSQLLEAQNKRFEFGFGIGLTMGGQSEVDELASEVRPLIAPQGSIRAKWRLTPNSAIGFSIATILLGNVREFDTTIPTRNGPADKLQSTSALLNTDILYRRYFTRKWYLQGGPTVNYMVWNRGSAYRNDVRLFKTDEIEFYKRWHLGGTLGLGYSTKVDDSRKGAPIQVDLFWFIELRYARTFHSAFQSDLGLDAAPFGFLELSTGFTFSGKSIPDPSSGMKQ